MSSALYNKTFLGPFHKINMCVYEKQFLKLVVMHNMRVFLLKSVDSLTGRRGRASQRR